MKVNEGAASNWTNLGVGARERLNCHCGYVSCYPFNIQSMMSMTQGEKGFPKEAGILTRIHCGLREISASTTMVAK